MNKPPNLEDMMIWGERMVWLVGKVYELIHEYRRPGRKLIITIEVDEEGVLSVGSIAPKGKSDS